MPALIYAVLPTLEPDVQERARTFWENAYAYALQSAPYGAERLDALQTQGQNALAGMAVLPPPQQENVLQKLREWLIDPIEGNTAQDYDKALMRLQKVTESLLQMTGGGQQPQPPMTGTAGPMTPPPQMMQSGGLGQYSGAGMGTMMPDKRMIGGGVY